MQGDIVTAIVEPVVGAKERLAEAVRTYLERTPPSQTVEIAMVGEAGSAGKTTLACTWAALLAQLGFLVEVVDLDGQGNASKQFGIGVSPKEDDNLLVLDKLYGEGSEARAFPAPLVIGDALMKRRGTFPKPENPAEWEERVVTLDDVRRPAYNPYRIPGYGVIVKDENPKTIDWLSRISVYPNGLSYILGYRKDFYSDEAELNSIPQGGMRLANMMMKTGTTPHFRIYDLHGTKSLSMMAALVRANKAINCVADDDKTTGPDLDLLVEDLEELREDVNPNLSLAMIVPGKIRAQSQRGKFGREMLDRLRNRHPGRVPDREIREAVTVKEAYHNREPLPMWVPNDPVTDDFRHVLAWAFENDVFAA